MYLQVIEKFRIYKDELMTQDGQISHQDAEILWKLKQLQWLYNRVNQLNDLILATQNGDYLFELEIYCEAFYHCAWRIEEVFKHHENFSISKKTKVRKVRNWLMMHPEGKNPGHLDVGIGTGGSAGPILKPISNNEAFKDEGFFVNAEDFKNKLNIALESIM